ncbi:unnamed protein product [Ranitomeya imitator]|uniref:RRM domain-containing protein n=1 Tax=Ranitomeya imitator TaxID=111125 RepID=A0ABN9KXV3_9NEOB|nr:unnamed protein product [Ranitomeya imitator]
MGRSVVLLYNTIDFTISCTGKREKNQNAEFEDHRDADDAVYELNGKELCNERVQSHNRTCQKSKRKRRRYDGWWRRTLSYALWLSTVKQWRTKDLKDFMRKAGEVTYVDAHRSNRNEGVVEFASYSDMKSALDKLDGMELSGRKIKLIEDRKKHRSRSKSRSYSRSRSKSKSRGSSRSASRSRSPSRTPEKKYSQKSSGEPSQSSPKRQSRSSSAESRG